MERHHKYYVVWQGHQIGVFNNYDECFNAIKGIERPLFKAFNSYEEAINAFVQGAIMHLPKSFIEAGHSIPTLISPKKKRRSNTLLVHKGYKPEKEAIVVDGACSTRTGTIEYRGIWLNSGNIIFHKGPFTGATNNIAEFLAIVEALKHLQKKSDYHTSIYTDSSVARSWVANECYATTIFQSNRNELIFQMLNDAVKWLRNNHHFNRVIQWETAIWGENPADFGRK